MIGAITWLAIDLASGHTYSHPAIPIWNAGVRLAFFVIISGLLTRLREAFDRQTLLAQRDGLTGIMNARTFRQQCDSLFKLAGRHRRPLALGYLDLDGFKGINDGLGHSVGDRVLKTIAATLVKHLRGSDSCARVGGDEFAILLPETGLTGARKFFTGLHQRLVELADKNNWPVGFSIGVAVFDPPAVAADDAIRHADELMYRVKKSGKNGTVIEVIGSASAGG